MIVKHRTVLKNKEFNHRDTREIKRTGVSRVKVR